MQKHRVILNTSCNKLTFWPGYCQHSKVKNLLVLLGKAKPQAESQAELYAPTLKLNEPIKKGLKLLLVPAKQAKVLKAAPKANPKTILKLFQKLY